MKFQKREVPSSGSDKFVKFKDGESKNVILRGEVYEYKMKWVNNKSILTTPQDPEGKSRFKVNAIVYEAGAFKAMIFEFPLTVYNKLADVNSEYPLDTTKIKITRQGIGTDTEYHILPLAAEKDKLTPNILAQISAIPLNILDTKPSQSTSSSPRMSDFPKDEVDHDFGEPPPEMDSELPF